MKILVTAKRVTDPDVKIRVKPDGSGIVTEGIDYKVNPFDEIAVEEAIRINEKLGGEVVAMETYAQLVDKDFTAQLTKIKAADPDALLICGVYTEGGLIMRQAEIAGLPDDVVTVGAADLNHRDFITRRGRYIPPRVLDFHRRGFIRKGRNRV